MSVIDEIKGGVRLANISLHQLHIKLDEIKNTLEKMQKPAEQEKPAMVPLHIMDSLFSSCEAARDGDLDKKINAIKLIRMITGCGLKEAKDLVEKYS